MPSATCERAIAIDTTFGLAYYKLALTRGWMAGTEDSIVRPADAPRYHLFGQPARRTSGR